MGDLAGRHDRAQAGRQVRLEGGRSRSSWRASSRPTGKPTGPFEFVVRGIFDADDAKHPRTDTSVMYFHYKYLYEATGRRIERRHLQRRDRQTQTRPAS